MNRRLTLFVASAISVVFLAIVIAGAVFVFSPFGRGGIAGDSHDQDDAAALDEDLDPDQTGSEHAADSADDQQPADEPPDDSLTIMLAGRDDRLTDSMMLVHIDGSEEAARILTIPRDLWYGGRKINEKYYYGGGEGMMNAVGEITGYQPEHYAVVDMDGFVEIIDHLGGIEITLDEPLYDHTLLMPDRQSRLDFDEGTHEVTGAEALLIARSRATSNDFERAKRQTRIIEGLQDRLTDFSFTDLPALYGIARTVYDYVDTDMTVARAVGYLLDYGIIDDFDRAGLSTDNVLEHGHSAYLPDEEVAHRSDWPEDMEELVNRRDPEEVEDRRNSFNGDKQARIADLVQRDREAVDEVWESIRERYRPDDYDAGSENDGSDEESDDDLDGEEGSSEEGSSEEDSAENGSSLFDPPAASISFKRRAIDETGIYRTLPARGAWLLQPVERDWDHLRWFSEEFFENGPPDEDTVQSRLGR